MFKNLLENKLLCLNTHFQKREGQTWTYKAPNSSTSQIVYVIINKKWTNCAKNCRSYHSFVSVASDHRIVSAQIRLTLRANKKTNNKPYDWSSLKNSRFEVFQSNSSTLTAYTSYKHFKIACKKIAKNIIPL